MSTLTESRAPRVEPAATLRELASSKPTSRDELAGVKGLGPAKLERYADDLLALISPALV